MDTRSAALLVIVAGLVIIAIGLVMFAGGLSWFGRLPGDIRYEGENSRIYIPITSMILISIVLSVAFAIARRLL